jgi:hypothetical protein
VSSPQPFAERDYYRDPRRRAKSLLVRAASRVSRPLGVDVELRHWYSPVPQLEDIDPGYWDRPSEMPGVQAFDTDAMLRLVEGDLAPAIAEFDPPRDWSGRPNDYFVDNGLFQGGDADVLYAMVRHHRPKRVIELGAGFSTLVCARACARNAADGDPVEFISYDPYAVPPAPGQVPGLTELRASRAEQVPIADFEALQSGDILFIDSSHTVRAGGDVTHLFGEVVPRLAEGVVVHVHDVYLPYPYPREWISHLRWYWAEQDLLRAYLAFNERVEVLWSAYAVHRADPARLGRAIPNYRPAAAPLSFWMRVRGGA